MSTSTPVGSLTPLPVGNWQADTLHSSVGFAVTHMGISTFRGRFEHLDATLTVDEDGRAQLAGDVRADSIAVKDQNLQGHLSSPEFFDTERFPELRFASSSIRREGDDLTLEGELTIKDQTHAIEAHGSITDPSETLGGAVKLGVTLETVLDRTQYGLNWQAPLPKGGLALANEVTLTIELEFARSEA
ncbi:MAG: YceI family protein [Solirubrobacteraceae bacterium]